ncbi:MAG: amidohydrolase [Chloroflexi bacterium]|nr:MAG: amidohydrolase [Chloroflexota bacterium]
MKLDAHQHFWQYNPEEYGWIGPDMAVLKQDRLPEDLLPLLQSAGLDGSIAVQARQSLAETAWLLELADRYPFIKGVVGWVDLCSPQVDQQLEQFSTHPKFRGVRHVVQDEPDDRFMLREDFLRGLGRLRRFGLTYDILIFPRHLPVAIEVVKKFPDQPFVLDHIAKPYIKDGRLSPWDADIRRLAELPNVVCKVSGMVTEADWQDWQADDFYPYLDVVFDAFGPERLMFGSDWPVCTLAGSYRQVVDLLAGYTARLSPAEQAAVWGQTAQKFYGVDE